MQEKILSIEIVGCWTGGMLDGGMLPETTVIIINQKSKPKKNKNKTLKILTYEQERFKNMPPLKQKIMQTQKSACQRQIIQLFSMSFHLKIHQKFKSKTMIKHKP